MFTGILCALLTKLKFMECFLLLAFVFFKRRLKAIMSLGCMILLMFLFCLPVNARTLLKNRVSVELRNSTVVELIKVIEDQTNLGFLYDSSQLRDLNQINISAQDELVENILSQVLENSGFEFEVDHKTILIKPLVVRKAISQQQKVVVKGRVTDASKLPLPGVTVVVKGTNTGVSTDMDGNYKISVTRRKNLTLLFSFVGMKPQEILVGSKENIDVVLGEDMVLFDEVLIKGAYGTAQKREDLVSSAFQVGAKKMANLPAVRVDQMLEGLVPGVEFKPSSDDPSSSRPRFNVRIRGEASMSASNEPLWIVDGTPIYTGDRTNQVAGMNTAVSPLTYINPDDIESITVLKDASATSIYGANGANGVILVTTKSGKAGQTKFHFSARYGQSHINKQSKFKVLDAAEYLMLAKESYMNAGKNMAIFPFTDNENNKYSLTDTDWYKEFYDIGSTSQFNLSVNGGNQKSRYYISGSYFRNEKTLKGNCQERYAVRGKNQLNLNDKLNVSFNLAGSYNINKMFSPSRDYYETLPIYSPYNEDGSYRFYNTRIDGFENMENPLWSKYTFRNKIPEREQNDNHQRTFAFNSNLSLTYDIRKNISYTTQIGIDYQSSLEDSYRSRFNRSGQSLSGDPIGIAHRGHSNFLTWTNIHRLNIEKKIGLHKIGGVMGFEATSREFKGVSAYGSGFVNDHVREIAYAGHQDGSGSSKIDRSMSLFAQASYSYDSRYYIVVNGRKDGNSNFGSDVRWGNFGSIGASWNINKEHFFNSDVINVLKIKGSFGSNGNSRLGSQEAKGLYSYNEGDRYMGQPGGSMSAGPNPNLSWETTYMGNVGIRIKLLNRLDINLEYYNNKTVDLLSKMDVSRTTGDLRVYRNVGSIRNQGVEMTVNSINIDREFKWETDFNISHNSNKILELYNNTQKVMGTKIWREGEDMNTYYLIRWAGVDPRDGAPMWFDARGNLTRVYNFNNRVADKSSAPLFSGGITNNFSYKGFNLRIIANYMVGGYAFSSFGRGVSSDGLNIMSDNQSVNQLDRWQKPGDMAISPKPYWGINTYSIMNSTRFLHEKTNIRLQNISLSYKLPGYCIRRIGVDGCTVSLVADNLGVWTPYDKDDRNSYRNTMSGYPMETTYSVSLNMSF